MYNIQKNDEDFNGILRKLTYITKHQNLYKDRDIVLSVSSTLSSSSNVSVTIDYHDPKNTYWISNNEQNSWYQIDLRNYKVKLTGYDYKAAIFNFFERWTVEGSDNGVNWTKVDEQTFDISNDTKKKTYYFDCNQNINKAFTYFRLTVDGNRGYDENFLFAIYRFDIYGYLYLNSYYYTLSKKLYPKISNNILFIFILS